MATQGSALLLPWVAILLSACGGPSVLPTPTQVTVRIASAESALVEQMTHLRVSAALHEADGSWKRSVSATFDRSELRWPVDVPVTPRSPEDASKEFEVVVQALEGASVLAETRAVTSFRRNKRVVLPLTLYTCDGPEPDGTCAIESCRGPQCNVCQADGSCAPVGVTDSDALVPLVGSRDGDDAGDDFDPGDGDGAGPSPDASRADASTSDAGSGGMLDAGGRLDAGNTEPDSDADSAPADSGVVVPDGGPADAGNSDAGGGISDAGIGTRDTSTPLCTTASCSDGRACNGVEVCNPSVGCQPGTPDNGSDDDGDGYSDAQGDCNDCVADINPSAAEMGGNTVDEDCDSQAPAVVPSCDNGLSLTSVNALDGARVLGLCKVGAGIRWGATAASYVQPDGSGSPSAVSYGLLPRFGAINPREGSAMLALSTGAARAPGDPGYVAPRPGLQKGYMSGLVPGLSTTTRHCNSVTFAQPYDGAALQLTLKVPSNVDRMAFDFAYFTTDWVSGICNSFDDQFAVTMKVQGSSAAAVNLAPDELGDVMSVNSQFVAACTCPTAPNCSSGIYNLNCSLGASSLAGSGFETGDVAGHSHASTGWLTTSVPVTPGSTLIITALIYDSGDGTYDSIALLDALRFYRAPAGDGQTVPLVKRAQ